MNKIMISTILLGVSAMYSAHAQMPGAGTVPDAPTKTSGVVFAPAGSTAAYSYNGSTTAPATPAPKVPTYAPAGTSATLNYGVSTTAKATTAPAPASVAVTPAPSVNAPTPVPSTPTYASKSTAASALATTHTVIQPGPLDGNTQLSMKYDAALHETPPVRVGTACAITLMPVVDGRLNRDTLGLNVAHPLLSGDAGQWATAGLQNLASFGFPVEMANAGVKQGGIKISPVITRAYTWQVGLKLFGTVVIKMDYTLPDGKIESRTFRATGDKNNIWGADDEYMTTLNYALNTLLKKVAADLENQCSRKT